MAQIRRRRQTKGRRRRVNWVRFLLFIAMLAGIAAIVYFAVRLLSGDEDMQGNAPQQDPISALPPAAEDTPIAPTPVPALTGELSLSPVSGTSPADFGFKTDIMVNGEIVSSYSRENPIRFGNDKEYTDLQGLITFGGNNYRNTFTYGTQNVENKKLEIIHEEKLGYLKTSSTTWSGTCWTGMPLIVEWPEDVRKTLGIKDEFKDKSHFTEVIYTTAEGHIYFLELSTGKRTRDPIKLGVTTKGTASLDPRGYPLLYTGQGDISTNGNGKTGAWFRIVDLIQNKVIWEFGQKDPFSLRDWQAYDSSALIAADADTLLAPGENGVFYSVKLNAKYDKEAGTVSVDPGGLEKYRYIGDGYSKGADDNKKRWLGIENSISVFRNYAYFTDNGGRMQCLDLNTFELQFVVDVTDDSDTSPVLEEDAKNNTYYLYTANEVDKQPGALAAGSGKSYHRKINGRTGEIVWQAEHEASVGNTSSNGGTLTTPHIGRNNLSDIVIYNATLVPVRYKDETGAEKTGLGGRIITYDKETGKELSRYEQPGSYGGYWSSPVVIYDKNGDGYLLQCDRNGMLRMHDPRDLSKVYAELNLGSRIESTPAVFGDYLVVGTRGNDNDSPKIAIVKIS